MSLAGAVLFIFLALLIAVLGAILLCTVQQILEEAEDDRLRRVEHPHGRDSGRHLELG